jgi:hypothetical protein
MERLMRDLRRLEDEIHASTSTPRRRSRCETSPDAPRARDVVVGFVARDDDDDDGRARASLRDARAAIEDAARALAVDEETEMRRGRALGALDATATDATGDEETTDAKRAATDATLTDATTKKRARRRRGDGCDDDGCDDIDPSITTPVVPRETRSTRASTTPT